MKYWIRINKESLGPVGPEQIRRISGITEDSLVFPDGATSASDWRRLRDVPELVQALRRPAAPPPPLPQGPPALSPTPLSTTVPAVVPKSVRLNWTFLALVTVAGGVVGIIGVIGIQHQRARTDVIGKDGVQAGKPPKQAEVAPVTPTVDVWAGKERESIALVKGFPTRNRGARFPLSISDVIQKRSYEPKTVGESVEGFLFTILGAQMKQAGFSAPEKGLKEKAMFEEIFERETAPHWSATRVAGPVYRVTHSTRVPFRPGAVTNSKPFEVNLEQRTLKPLTALTWMALDLSAAEKWVNASGNQSTDADVSAVATSYRFGESGPTEE